MSDLHALNLKPGDIVGGYTLDSRLGAGAMGSVWRVTDGGGTSYAMKILRDSLNDDAVDEEGRRAQATARERLRREAMALKRIKDPGVCSIVDMELDDSLAFIVTELIEGDNLREDVVRNGRYVGGDLERLAVKLIDAVRAVHGAGIVHRDIKPTNVMVSVTGPILVDFGIAMGEGESHVTSTGLVMGTPGFIAPEIIEGHEATEATDWWSTASVLAFAATGAPVFGTQPMLAVLQREAAGNANLQGLPPRTMQAFRAALSPQPGERCTPDELLDAISADAWEAESNLPFEASAPATGAAFRKNESVDNPRSLWRAQSMPTASILFPAGRPRADGTFGDGAIGDGPVHDGAANGSAADAIPAQAQPAREPLRTVVNQEAAALDPPAPPTATRPLGAADEAATTPLEHTTSALPQTRVLETAADGTGMPGADAEATQAMLPPSPRSARGEAPACAPQPQRAGTDEPPWQAVMPQQTTQQGPQQMAQPALVDPTSCFAARGRLACLLLTIPFAALAASLPVVALIAASCVLWTLMAIGYNAAAQTARMLRHQGERRGSDNAIRAISFPWHLLKSTMFIIPNILALWLVMALAIAITTVMLGLPCHDEPLRLFGWDVMLGVPDMAPASATGATCAAAFAAGWLPVVLGPGSVPIRLGAGHVLGLTRRERERVQLPPADDRRQWVWLAILVACTCAAAINIEVSPAVGWWPLLPR